MLRVLILLHDANDHGRTTVVEEVKIVNDGSGDVEFGNYELTRFSDWDGGQSAADRITNFPRSAGAYELARAALEQLAGP